MGFEFFIARRYLLSKRGMQFISVINLISIIGITVGVAALLIVLSVFNGFSGVVTKILITFDPHIRIEKHDGMGDDEYRLIENLLTPDGRVRGFSPFVTGKVMIVTRSSGKVVYMKGVDEQKIGDASGIKEKIVFGSLILQDSGYVGSIVMGLTLSDRLGAAVGDEVAIVSPYVMNAALTPLVHVAPTKFKIVGIFESNNREYDANYVYVSVASAQRLLNNENRFSGVEIRLSDIELVDEIQATLAQQLSHDFQISSWYDLHKDLYSVMKIERWAAYIILCLIIVVAAFNVLGSLTMSVIEKQRDIGVLQSMGTTSKSVIRIFLYEGIFVGMIGTILGMGLGLILLFLQIEYHLFPLDTSVYIIPAIPVEIQPLDFVAVSLASLMVSALAAYYPARRAAKIVLAEAIRWE